MSILGKRGMSLDPSPEVICSGDASRLMAGVEEVRAAVEACLLQYESRPFAWPTDGVCGEPWGYAIHVGWVVAWNKAGRPGSSLDFLRAWMADDRNVLLALLWTALRDLLNAAPPSSQEAPAAPADPVATPGMRPSLHALIADGERCPEVYRFDRGGVERCTLSPARHPRYLHGSEVAVAHESQHAGWFTMERDSSCHPGNPARQFGDLWRCSVCGEPTISPAAPRGLDDAGRGT